MRPRELAGSAAIALVLGAFSADAAAGEEGDPAWKWILDARLRAESFETPSASAALDRDYDLYVGRVRAGGELSWKSEFTLRGVLQAAFADNVPGSAAFATGQTIFNTNLGDTSPADAGLLELAFLWKRESFTLALGRQAWSDGAGTATGIAHLDWVRTRRLAERLVGNAEYTNVARRFDGATFLWRPEGAGAFELFALRPLGGVQNYTQALDGLEVDVEGLAWATPYDVWIPKTALRLFAQRYRDGRDVAKASAGGEIRIRTFGASLLAGNESWDVLAWGAVQRGDYGAAEQHAWAFAGETGYRFTGTRGEPSVHFGWEQASGGAGPGESRNFWNGLPTNHKFYGSLDYIAFSNLRDVFLEARWAPAKSLTLSAAIHDFRLADRAAPWVSGTGAMSDNELGFGFRRPPGGGGYASSELGRELDLTVAWTIVPRLVLKLESGKFFGGDAAEEALPVEADGTWAGLDLTWTY